MCYTVVHQMTACSHDFERALDNGCSTGLRLLNQKPNDVIAGLNARAADLRISSLPETGSSSIASGACSGASRRVVLTIGHGKTSP